MERALVTGATGFIGRHLVQTLLAHRVETCIVVRSEEKARALFGNYPNLRMICCDMNNIRQLPKLLGDEQHFDVCFHFAWGGVSGEGLCDASLQLKNVEDTLALLSVLQQVGVPKFVGAGSIHEIECCVACEAEQPMSMANMYKSAKLAAHHMARAYCNNHQIDFCWPIITNTYGVGEKSARLIITTIEKLRRGQEPQFSAGTQLYDFVEVTDVAQAFYLVGCGGKSNRNYVICNLKPNPLKAYLTELGALVNPQVKLRFGEADVSPVSLPRDVFDCRALMEDTGFRVQVPFNAGIQKILRSLE